ncbi:MAG: hypothetical protein WC229_01125 [Candidatus Paceibacterota bacterium]|jgi:hypothetical protein
MKKTKLIFIILLTFLTFICIYYFIPIKTNLDKTFITISTFVFTVLTGFFISRQGNRYSEIRKSVSSIDGNFSSIYRSFGHLNVGTQEKVGQTITRYYLNILESKIWNYNFINKTTTLTDIHRDLEQVTTGSLSPVAGAALSRIMTCLGNIQVERKNLVVVCEERIPTFQWITISFLSFTLLFTLLVTIPSNGLIAESFLKGIFSTSIIIIIILLKQLDRLELFEGVIGEHSAKDVIEIIESKK